jgi:large subunit ribosomal protein L2
VGLRKYNPTTPGQRGKILLDFKELTKKDPEKSLSKGIKFHAGRDNAGRISVRRKGGRGRRKYRLIDFKRDKRDIEATVKSIEYDPNRTANIALVAYADGEKRYILAPEGLNVGHKIINGENAKSITGNTLPMGKINIGSFIHNIEIREKKGGQLVRSAGSFAKILGRDGKYVSVEMPSGEVRLFLGKCYATVGELANKDHKNIMSGKAGRSRWQGKRPKVRGVVMNPVDHPMGGGEGRSSGGRHPCSPTGLLAKGYKTRRKNKYSDKFIIRKKSKKR